MADSSYADSGVDYSKIDPVKVLAQKKAKSTSNNLGGFGFSEMAASRGESAYVWQEGDDYKAFVVEGLGTKNLVADETSKFSGKSHYDTIAQDTVAMVVNDLIVVGALPIVVNAYFAIGDSSWFENEDRASDLVNGWAKACDLSGATWGGGETPSLTGIINPETIDLGGASIGVVREPSQLVLGDKLSAGNAIVLVESSGIHANGLTLARKIGLELDEGYATKLPSGISYGESLLSPTHIYVELVKQTQDQKIDINYMVNVTGHGWRKLMRAEKEFTYRINQLPDVPELFEFIADKSESDEQEMYGNFNMGAGFALFVAAEDAERAVDVAKKVGLKAWNAGVVEEGSKQVVIEPNGVTFSEDSLGVRDK